MASTYVGKVFDNYRILENLGVGGMGVVFKAIHIKLDKIVALKMIAPGLTMNENFIKRFQVEARALAKLEDPNIVRISDLRSDRDQWFIVMEYVEGENLYDLIRKNGAYKWQTAIPIAKQILSALGHAHDSGIVHRDVKPNNVMITSEGVVKVTDFGLAKDQTSVFTTMTIASGGTLYYMSPEHLKGFSFTDTRSDIYSVGMTFYEMLTGKVPFQNIDSDFDIRESIVRKQVDSPRSYVSELPADLEEIIMKSLAKNPDHRYQACQDMIAALEEFEKKQKEQTNSVPQLVIKDSEASRDTSIRFVVNESIKDKKISSILLFFKNQSIYGNIGAIMAGLVVVIFMFILFKDNSEPKVDIQSTDSSYQALNISSLPALVSVFINGDSIGQTPLRDYPIDTGMYRLALRKPGYKTVDSLIEINRGTLYAETFMLKVNTPFKEVKITEEEQSKRPVRKTEIPAREIGNLAVSSRPSKADVILNGRKVGLTPITLEDLPAGAVRLQIRKTGYSDYSANINIRTGETNRIRPTLKPFTGILSIATQPPGAKIKINSDSKGSFTTPLSQQKLVVGNHEIVIDKPGYKPITETISIERNKTTNISYELNQLKGKLQIQIRPWGAIYIDDELQQTSTDVNYEIELPVDSHRLKIVHPSLGKWEKDIAVRADYKREIVVNFNQMVSLNIASVDENGAELNANIFIDEQSIGQKTPGSVDVNIGVHRFSVRKDGYLADKDEREILIEEGYQHDIIFNLKKIE